MSEWTIEQGLRSGVQVLLEGIGGCRYSFHDLSWTQRLNCTFELGLTYGLHRGDPAHSPLVFARSRVKTSDLHFLYHRIHRGTTMGVFQEGTQGLDRQNQGDPDPRTLELVRRRAVRSFREWCWENGPAEMEIYAFGAGYKRLYGFIKAMWIKHQAEAGGMSRGNGWS